MSHISITYAKLNKAIAHAKSKWAQFSNVQFHIKDVRKLDLAQASFDVCLWEAAIEHFTVAEMDGIMASVRKLLVPGGVLHGHTIKKEEHLSHHDHEHEFESLDELKRFLLKYFKHVAVWERAHPDRTSYYFRCSDEPVSRGDKTS